MVVKKSGRLMAVLVVALLAVVLPSVAASADDTINVVGGRGEFMTDIEIGPDGNPVVAWIDQSHFVHVTTCKDPACADFFEPKLLKLSNGSSVQASWIDLEVASDGEPTFALKQWPDSVGSLTFVRCRGISCAGADSVTPRTDLNRAADDQPTIGFSLAMELDSSDNPLIAFQSNDSPVATFRLMRCVDPMCSQEPGSNHVESFGGGWPSMQLDASGNPVLSFWYPREDFSGGGLRVAHCEDPGCVGETNNITIPDAPTSIRSTSLRLDAAGNPTIAFESSQTVGVIRCADPNCVVSAPTASAPGVSALYSELALDSSGSAIVTFFDRTKKATGVFHCATPICTSSTLTHPGGEDSAGQQVAAIVSDAAGLPAIAYISQSNVGGVPGFNQVNVLKCDDPGCSPASCFGREITVDLNKNETPTTGDDVILGTPGPDVIDGLEGSDTICGGGGDDVINGGVGDFRDFLFGGDGDDTINGGFGIDYIYGEAGEDTLDGDGGSDRLFGGPDNDVMLGDSGADRMYGGPGDDDMRGMGGQDFMWGEAGNDLMQGNFQTDNMWGGPGDDQMFGTGGKDSLFGEGGNDTLNGGLNTDYLDGGDGVDTANGGRGRDKPLLAPQIRASNGQFFDGSGCIAETIANCQPTP